MKKEDFIKEMPDWFGERDEIEVNYYCAYGKNKYNDKYFFADTRYHVNGLIEDIRYYYEECENGGRWDVDDIWIECGHVERTGDEKYLWETMYDERFYVIYNGEYLIEE